ncbi:MAG TPA: DUF3592 domain-containing protein [Tepidisphaeraceae bacterium]|nr:DUF3592 domain-containing protein [Tepidisphaeraceae bacterium]
MAIHIIPAMGRWIISIVFGGVAMVFIGVGLVMAWHQDAAIRNAEPVKATITLSAVDTSSSYHKGRRHTRHTARISYNYTVGGETRTSKTIYPGGMNVGGESAHDLVARFPKGSTVDAFFDRRDASAAFLLKRHDFGPYLFILFPMLHLSIGLILLLSGGSSKKLPPIEKGNGQWLLPTGMTTASKFNNAALLAGVWWLVGGFAIFHYFRVAERPYDSFAVWVSVVYLAVGIAPLWTAAHFWSLMHKVSDALVTTDAYPIRRGHPLKVNVKLELAGGGNIETATATLVCRRTIRSNRTGKNQTHTDDAWISEQPFAPAQDLVADRTISGDVVFHVPFEQLPTTLKGDRSYPRYQWELRLLVKRSGPDYKSKFVVQVV